MGNLMLPRIVVLGFSEAGMFMRRTERRNAIAIISIFGEQEFGVEAEVGRRLDLRFDDVAAPDAGDMVANYQARMRLREAAENGRVLWPPAMEDARAIVEFAREIREVEGIVLCHCSGGISRSPAAAVLCLATWMGAGREQEAVEYVRSGAAGGDAAWGFGAVWG